MKKRIISLLLVVMMLLGTSLSTNAKYFTDISSSSTDQEIFDAINYMSDNGYMNGTSEGVFNPDMNVTRGMLVYLLYVYSGDSDTYTHPYTDVSSSQYYANAVGWAYQNQITSGTSATTFSPNATLTREQFICILYNYATKFEGRSFTGISSTAYTAYVDSANVSSYARNAINWALHFKILQPDSSNRLGPKDIVSRVILATYVYRYSLNVEQINFDKDVMSISHTKDNFGESYYLSDTDKAKIDNYINTFYGTNRVPDQYKSIVSTYKNREWIGSCFGITMVTALDKLGYLAFNENFAENMDLMSDITGIGDNLEAQSIINAYQLSQSYSFGKTTRYYKNKSNYSTGLSELIDSVKNNALVVFGFYWVDSSYYTHGHAILAYDYKLESNGSHTITAYDCNSVDTPIKITIDSLLTNCSVEGYTTSIGSFNFIDEFDAYKYFYDFDGLYNDMNMNYPVDTSPLYNDSSAVEVKVLSYGDYTLECEEGEVIVVENGEVSGTIEIYDELTLPEYENNMCTTTYTVPQSGCYVLETGEGDFVFEIYGEHYNTTLSGTCSGNARIIIGWDGYVYLSENVETFNLLTCVDNDNYDIINISGSTNGDSTFIVGDTTAQLYNISSVLSVTYTNYEGNIDNSVTIPYSGSDVTLTYPTN